MAYATRRSYAGAAPSCTITNTITSGDTTITLTGDVANWNTTASGPFYAVIDPGLATEEKILVASRTSTVLSSITRGVDGTVAAAHTAGAICYPIFTAVDADQANAVASALTTKGDLLVTDGSVLTRLPVNATDGYTLLTSAAATNGVVWGQVANAGVATGAAIDKTKIAGTAVTLSDTGTVTSTMIANTTIVQGDLAVALLEAICPVGTISAFADSTAPAGWILCNGTAVVSGTHPKLYAICTTTPDLRGRTVIGVGTGTGLTARTLNATGGFETHALTTAELANHSHSITGPTGGMSANSTLSHSITDPGHSHEEVSSQVTSYTTAYTAGLNSFLNVGSIGVQTSTVATGISIASHTVSHTHTLPTDTGGTGSGTAHNNMQPFYALNYIIKHDYV